MQTDHQRFALRLAASRPLAASLSLAASLCLAGVLLLAACGSDTQIDATGSADQPTTAAAPATTGPPGADDINDPTRPAAALELSNSQRLWSDVGIQNYTYTFSRSCECPDDQLGPFRVTVTNGEIEKVESLDDVIDYDVGARTIPEMFDAIAATIDGGAQLDVTYEATTGHPVSVLLDIEALAVDGGDAFTIESFSSADFLAADLTLAREQWEEAAVASYRFTYKPQCFCPQVTRTVTVVDGQVTEVSDLGDTIGGLPPLTIDDLFNEVAAAVEGGAFAVNVTYDEALGFPSDYFIDPNQFTADEEHGVLVIDFQDLTER
ncbi:MAG: hypothetical protein ACI8TP_003765 [Acidimicrobiales bacterium]|jgi:hypothetical protein